ncbi:MAG: SPL family radical SAM protein [Candidatus Saccharicenans sp.]
MKKSNWIKKIYLDKGAENEPLSRRILDKLPGIPVELLEDIEKIKLELRLNPDPVAESKKIILLTKQKSFLRPCPCSPGAISCGYWTIDLDLNCPLDCSYCILQSYFDHQPMTISINRESLKSELDTFFENKKNRILRVGTGELGDSLALDNLTENSIFLAGLFRGKENFFLELKTKTDNIEQLLKIKALPNVIIAWSLNTERIIETEEKGTANLENRLRAALQVINHGYRVAFHFDPIIYYQGWEQEYQEIIKKLFKLIPLEKIAWISLGTLRFPAAFVKILRRRFPNNEIYSQEFIKSWEGKYRYPRPLRTRIYLEMKRMIAEFKAENQIYLCMESALVWRDFLAENKRGKLTSAFPFPWLS